MRLLLQPLGLVEAFAEFPCDYYREGSDVELLRHGEFPDSIAFG